MSIERVLVGGGGQMGSGIAQVMAQIGITVVLRDINEELVRKGLAGSTRRCRASSRRTS